MKRGIVYYDQKRGVFLKSLEPWDVTKDLEEAMVFKKMADCPDLPKNVYDFRFATHEELAHSPKSDGVIRKISVAVIKTDPSYQPRKDVTGIKKLAESIRSVGQLSPCHVVEVPEESGYTMVAGHRRLEAARELKLDTIDCIVHPIGTSTQVIALAENLGRENLTEDEIFAYIENQPVLFELGDEAIAGITLGDKNRVAKWRKGVELKREAAIEEQLSFEQLLTAGKEFSSAEELKCWADLGCRSWGTAEAIRAANKDKIAAEFAAKCDELGVLVYDEERDGERYSSGAITGDWGNRWSFENQCGCDGFRASISYNGDTEFSCVKPENHEEWVNKDKEAKEREERKAKLQELKEVDLERRTEFVSDLFMKDERVIEKLDLWQTTASRLIELNGEERLAKKLYGIDVDLTSVRMGDVHVILALGCAVAEGVLDYVIGGSIRAWAAPRTWMMRDYYDGLRAAGYEMGEFDKAAYKLTTEEEEEE